MKNKLTVLFMPALMGFLLTSPAPAGNIGPNANGSGSAVTSPACGFSGSPVYCNGPINGNTDAWTMNFGFAVSDSFTTGGGILTSAELASWLSPGDSLTAVDWAIGTSFFNSDVASGTGQAVSLVTDLGINQFGYDVTVNSFNFGGSVFLNAGTYYLTLQNAVSPSGDPIYWDENNGPSLAKGSYLGTIPSESFAVYGECDCGPPTPEPDTLILCGSGLVLLFGVLRRKLPHRKAA